MLIVEWAPAQALHAPCPQASKLDLLDLGDLSVPYQAVLKNHGLYSFNLKYDVNMNSDLSPTRWLLGWLGHLNNGTIKMPSTAPLPLPPQKGGTWSASWSRSSQRLRAKLAAASLGKGFERRWAILRRVSGRFRNLLALDSRKELLRLAHK